MFKKLRIRLTIFNLLIISLILLLIAFFAFIGSPRNDSNSVNQNMLDAALSGSVPQKDKRQLNQLHNGQGGLIYMRVDINGDIVDSSTQIALDTTTLQTLAEILQKQTAYSGNVNVDSIGEFVYLRVIFDPEQGQVLVLQEVIGTGASLFAFISRIGPVMGASLILVFLASLSISAKALVPIKKAWEKQVEFTADASHELRTPLSVMQINLEAATDEPDATIREKRQWLDNVYTETRHMAKLVDDLLTLSRSDTGQQTLCKTTFALDEALLETVLRMKPYAQRENLIIQDDVEKGIVFTGDRERMKQLVVILLDNAIKYSVPPATINISAKKAGRNIEITVADTGEGIETEQIGKIFDRFYRVDKSRTQEKGGSGLGLSIAKWIVVEHHGDISVTSTQEVGTKFTVILPTNKS